MPSRAAYTALAVSRSDTGCRTILIPWVEEPVTITPEVVGHIDPAGWPGLRREAPEGDARSPWLWICASSGICRRRARKSFSIPDRSGHLLRHTRRHPCRGGRHLAPVGAGRHPDQLGETGAEGAQRRAADRETDLGDAEV